MGMYSEDQNSPNFCVGFKSKGLLYTRSNWIRAKYYGCTDYKPKTIISARTHGSHLPNLKCQSEP